MLWHKFLLHYGAHSERIYDFMAELARQLSNSIVDWTNLWHQWPATSLLWTNDLALDQLGLMRNHAEFWKSAFSYLIRSWRYWQCFSALLRSEIWYRESNPHTPRGICWESRYCMGSKVSWCSKRFQFTESGVGFVEHTFFVSATVCMLKFSFQHLSWLCCFSCL